ncbi:PspC domain-containing protein [Patescibacteria group bacterium]|nr:PspC domain-containing protein [Patescibacteria group bacterium]
MEHPKKLYRSRKDKMIAGVCGGIAEYVGMDATMVRILFILFGVFVGSGILLYIILLILVPLEPGA